MVGRDQFINKLRALGYTYKKQNETTSLWRRGTHRVNLPHRQQLEETWVRATLRHCGCDDDEIREFVRAANA